MIKKVFLSRLSKNIDSLNEPMSYDRSNSVGIISLFSYATQANQLAKELEMDGKRPRTAIFVNKFDKTVHYPEHTFSAKDISITGSIQSDELLYFTKQTYDFLLCIDPSGDDYIKFLLSKVQARHRIGLFHTNFAGHLDMMIKPISMEYSIRDLMKYVKMIKNDQ